MAATFKIGDVVQLKSSGPKMTVSGAKLSDGDIPCTWFDATGNQKFSAFHPDMLVPVDVGR